MKDLIKIDTNSEGVQVVSARELHGFLNSKQQFADWIKKRIAKYGLVENQDYTTVSLVYENGGGRSIEYALTLDAAKELAMVEGNEKGKQARLYFIECEKKLTQKPSVAASADELILMLAQRNVETVKRLSAVEEKVEKLQQIQAEAKSELQALPAPTTPMAEMGIDDKIRRIVNNYASATITPVQEVWRKLYSEMYYRYHVSINSYKLNPGESKLQMVKRVGHLEKLYTVATNVLQIQA